MKIIKASHGGFCFGVRRAVKLAEDACQKNSIVYSLGPLIHNRPVIERLSQKGVKIIDSLKDIHRGDTLLIRSHGVHPYILEEAKIKGISITDATCPFVSRCQKLAQLLVKEGYRVIVFGDKNHSEVRSIVGFTGDKAKVVASPAELKTSVRGARRVGLLSQTTQSKDAFKELVTSLLDIVPEVKIFNTICQAATLRQEEAKRLSKKVDLAIVVGGKDSANTTRIASVFRNAKVKTYHVEDMRELRKQHLNGHKVIGVVAGASAPDWITEEIIEYLYKRRK